MIAGSSPTIPQLIILASGSSPSSAAFDADLITTAAAPSTTPDALPAVTKLSGPNAVLNSANDSGVLPRTTWSSSLWPISPTLTISCSQISLSIEFAVLL